MKNLEEPSRTALITGAHGFIGKHLARSLSKAGYKVCGLGHGIWPEAEASTWGVSQWINGDVAPSNLRLLQHSFGTPDVVYHLAGGSSVGMAIANPREDFFRTVATTAELLDWMRLDAPEARLVAVSSAAVYGAGHAGRIAEQATLNPYSPYGHHKRLMEELCRSYAASYGTKVVVARLFSVFGSGLKKQLLWDLCTRLAAGANPLTLGGTGEELRDWTDVRDVVRALALLADTASSEVPVFNVGTGKATPVREVAALLATHWAKGHQPAALSFSGQSRKGDPFSLVADPSGTKALEFEWRVELDQGLADYVNWFQRHEAIQP
jgi:UDP-glucose 4-epimerase